MAFCSNCGGKIEDGLKFCPCCGKALNDVYNNPDKPLVQEKSTIEPENNGMELKKKLNTMALIGFISGLISLLLNFWGIVGIIACIFSGIGLGKFNSKTENNKWMAILGILLGIYSIIYAISQMY